jgi:hypothetical protein
MKLDTLGRLVREAVPESGAGVDVAAVFERRRPRRPLWAAGLVVAAAALALAVFVARRDDAAVAIVDADDESGFIEAKVTARRVAFSDGSVLVASTGSRVRVGERTSRGATITLEAGAVDFDIRHRDDTRWAVQAGPVEVRVRGTVFSVRYDPVGEQVDVALTEGRVEVLRTGFAPVVLTKGQTVHIDAGRKRLVLDDDGAPDASIAPIAPPPPVEPVEVRPPPKPLRPAAVTSPKLGSLERPLEVLLAEAERLRLERRIDEAVAAYQSIRQRSPGTPTGALAAFQVGRLEELRGRTTEARRWYEAAVDDAVDFSFRPEALGRLMVLLEQQGEGEAARARAREYLEVAPAGGWSALARRLVGTR